MAEARTYENLDLGEHEIGYSWVAGGTPPNDPGPGEWFVKNNADGWVVMFRSAPTGVEYLIQTFPPTDDGERAAKVMANKLVDIAWESYKGNPRHQNKIEEVLW